MPAFGDGGSDPGFESEPKEEAEDVDDADDEVDD